MTTSLIGRRFGGLAVIGKRRKRNNRSDVWVCECDCGNLRVATTMTLKSGSAYSCGKCGMRKGSRNRVKPEEVTGKKFGRLTILECQTGLARCRCDCGNEISLSRSKVVSGRYKSCGCLKKEARRIHGESRTRLFYRWQTMIASCRDPRASGYPASGALGIKVCDRWQRYELFAEDMRPSFFEGSVLIHRDKRRDFCKENCYWGTRAAWRRAGANNPRITANGLTLTYREWEERLSLRKGTIARRKSQGVPEDRWLEPVVPKKI